MKLAVLGLWHLGSVTAACMAAAGHDVVGWDPDPATLRRLEQGRAPVAEPGLDDLLSSAIAGGRLRVTASLAEAVTHGEVVWITFDTPVDENDRADVEAVMTHVHAALAHVRDGALVISSSQLPVGSLARMARAFETIAGGRRARFACCPENLRLGAAIRRFTDPERIVAGIRRPEDREAVAALFAPLAERIVWMDVESAEMTKHAINAFMAASIAFINEIAAICEGVGADAKQVERGLKSDARIGPGARLSPGAAYAGGTLARDVAFLQAAAATLGLEAPLLHGVDRSNREHAGWAHRTLRAALGSLQRRRIAVWGLTYKPGTDTLRRSPSIELCTALAQEGAMVTAFDPAIGNLPESLLDRLTLAADPLSAAAGAEAVVVATEWPVLRDVDADALVKTVSRPVIVDAGRFLAATLGADPRVRYLAVGVPR